MAQIRVIHGHHPDRLLEHAADGFLKLPEATLANPWITPTYLLAVRQGGLRDDLIALAAARGVKGWFDPPLCVFGELPEWLGSTALRPCGEHERQVLVGNVLRKAAGSVFGRVRRPEAFVEAVEQLFGELCAEVITPETYARSCDSCDGRDEFQVRRDSELVRAYELYVDSLRSAGMRDGRDAYVDCAEAVAQCGPEHLSRRLRGRREIRIFGLNDVRGGWKPLLEALVRSPALDTIAIYTSVELDLPEDIATERIELDEEDSLAARLFTARPRGDETVDLIVAPDAEREMEEVARRVRGLLDSGVNPRRIAIVARQSRPYTELALRALESFGVPGTARRRHDMHEIPVVRAVLALFAAAAAGWRRHELVELAEQPYVGGRLDPVVFNWLGYRRGLQGLDAWDDALRKLEDEALARENRLAAGESDDDRLSRGMPSHRRVAEARAGFRKFSREARALDRSAPLAEWLEWLDRVFSEDGWGLERRIYQVPNGRAQIARMDLEGWRVVRGTITEWRGALGLWGDAGELLAAKAFDARLREVLVGEIQFATEVSQGVRVIEGLAAAYRSFDHTFLVGLESGRFPARAPTSSILDEGDRAALVAAGLPLDLPSTWEYRERELFRSLVATAHESLTLCYSALDSSGREALRSSFVEAVGDAVLLPEEKHVAIPASRVLTPGMPVHRGDYAVHQALHAASIERVRQTGVLSPWNGLIEQPALLEWLAEEFGDDRLWSPTQLESYAKCPWSYISARLYLLEKLEDPSDDVQPTLRGIVLHDALKRFYDAALERSGGRPIYLRQEDLEWTDAALAIALKQAVAAVEQNSWLGHPSLRAAWQGEMLRLLVKFIAAEVREHEDSYNTRTKVNKSVRTGVVQHELPTGEVSLDVGAVRLRYRGFIDRVEQGVDEREDTSDLYAAVDYKTTKYSTPGGGEKQAWEDHVVLQVPLYAHALQHIWREQGARIARVEYRSLKSSEAIHALELHQIYKKTGLTENPDAAARMNAALEAVATHVLNARQGKFPALPAKSCKCPDFCHAWDVCRTKGGPQSNSW